MQDLAGSRYRILEPIGSGGMGSVFKAEDTRLKRVVALKFLPKDFTADSEAVERFEREAQAAAALDHPNICTVYEICTQEEEDKFLVMAYLEGESLDKRIESGPLSLDMVFEIGRQVAEGLSAAHSAGVVHRDIKPSNIMLGEDRAGKPVAKLMDFGMAQVSGASKLTRVDTRVGTTAYMSPEQALGDPVDARTDIWSTGIVLYEAVAGEMPFKGHYDQAILYSILNEEPEPVTAVRSKVPLELEWIIDKCLAKAPADRYQDARELIVDIERLQRRATSGRTSVQPIERDGETPGSSSSAVPSQQPSWVGALARRWQAVAVAAAVITALAVALVLVGGNAESPQQTRRFTLRPVDAEGQDLAIGDAAISPDGTTIAFTTGGSDGSLWIQPLNSHEPYRVEGTAGARTVFWAPDSESVGFSTSASLGKFALRDRTLTTLVDDPGLGFVQATWSSDGQAIIYAPAGRSPMRVPSSGGAARALFGDGPRRRGMITSISTVGISDDEAVLLYSVHTAETDDVIARRMVAGEVGPPVELVEGAEPVFCRSGLLLYRPTLVSPSVWAVEFSPDGLAVSGDPFTVVQGASGTSLSVDGSMVHLDNPFNGQMALRWLDASGRVLSEIGKPQAWIVGPRLSPAGDRVLVSGGTGRDYDLWVHEADRPVLYRVTFDDADESGAIWSPDGNSVLYAQRGSDELSLLPMAAGGPAEPLYAGGEPFIAPLDWSRDGRHILLQVRTPPAGVEPPREGGRPPADASAPLRKGPGPGMLTAIKYLERAPSGEWEQRDFLPATQFVTDDAVFSPNGRYVAYESNESGQFEVYVKPFPVGQQRWQVSTDGGRLAKWDPEGTYVYFISVDTLYRVPVRTTSAFELGDAEELFTKDSFMAARRYPSYDVGTGGRIVVSGPQGGPRRRAIRITQNWRSELPAR